MKELFNLGTYVLHSGLETDFKIDCDALTPPELRAMTRCALGLLPPFRKAYGIATGGLKFAQALNFYAEEAAWTVIIADDVLTTGRSFEDFRRHLISDMGSTGWASQARPDIKGIVLFARGPCPQWVTPIFTLNPRVPQEQEHDRNNDRYNDSPVRSADRKVAA